MNRFTRLAIAKFAVAALIGTPLLHAQAVPAAKEFEVASVKPAAPVNDYGKGIASTSVTPLGVSLRNYSLQELVQWAWHVRKYQVSGPAWIGSERYDIAAKVSAPVGEHEMRQMLQRVLTERFKLDFHNETKEFPVYLLEAGKNGPKLQPTQVEAGGATRLVNGAFVFDHLSMDDFADRMSSFRGVDRPVLNRTGIEGYYDISIKMADSNKDLKIGLGNDDSPSVFRLVTEQLGLRLTPGKAPIDSMVVDRADKVLTGN